MLQESELLLTFLLLAFCVPPSNPRRSPRQRRSQETYDAIVEAAAQVFEARGYAAGTTNRIAERAGVSIGSLYQYFDGKDAVLLAVAEEHLAEGAAVVAPALAALADDPEPVDLLRDVLRVLVDLHRQRPQLHRLLYEEAPLPAAFRRKVLDLEEAVATEVALYLARRPVPPDRPELTARLLVATVETLAHRHVLHPDGTNSDQAFVEAGVRLLAAGL
jgi:AcrR family transcriptional regulator